jgi:lactoylglutathione lyase
LPIRQLRLVVTAADYDAAVHFYRDVLGLTEQDAVQPPNSRVMVLDAGRATLELAEPASADYIDGIEVGNPGVSGHIRVAFEVDSPDTTARVLAAPGVEVLSNPRPTPFKSTNARVNAPAGLQLTLFHMD